MVYAYHHANKTIRSAGVQFSDGDTPTRAPDAGGLFGLWTRVGPRKHVLHGVHIGATEYDLTVHVRQPCKNT